MRPPVSLALEIMVSASNGLMVNGSMILTLVPEDANSSAAFIASTRVTQAPITVTLSLGEDLTTCKFEKIKITSVSESFHEKVKPF